MDHTAIELAVVCDVEKVATETQLAELNDLQLALVGGGIGDTII